ncbi:uncharacterized protein FIBRA_05845 [Fibroporia radiculosa]|uniref:PhoD-like phosphatase domain-containing protein n=1 Tax=Fibroporia radiculosa TaxID=599839 RepID=J4H3R4_9APHY|nr:uncharacterized protein FIBRA_05845 [Fibroporia radiculosa]CCM03699.1 predicted protein [Fibroporia radiculosa]
MARPFRFVSLFRPPRPRPPLVSLATPVPLYFTLSRTARQVNSDINLSSPPWIAQEDHRRRSPQRGPDGLYQPLEQVYPLPPSPGSFDTGAPSPPPVDDLTWPRVTQDDTLSERRLSPRPTQKESAFLRTPSTTSVTHQLARMSAVERSRSYKVAQMNPHLQLMAGPLLRYDTVNENSVWFGAAMVVTADAGSSYDPTPTLTYSWDPNAPLRTPGNGTPRSHRGYSVDLAPHPADPLSSAKCASEQEHSPDTIIKVAHGEEIYVYEGPGGTNTFWRFMLEIPLGRNEMRINYSLNSGLTMQFHVPARSQNMRWAAYSCNGFSAGVNPSDFCGPGFRSGYDPVWVDLLEQHAAQPFHALVGGGDQLYCDGVVREPEMQEWLNLPQGERKRAYAVTDEMCTAIDRFYFNHYCQTFRSGAFARANSSIPMVNMLDDHDLVSPVVIMARFLSGRAYGIVRVFNGPGGTFTFSSSSASSAVRPSAISNFSFLSSFTVADVDGRDGRAHPFKSHVLGARGPFIPYPSHSIVTYLGPEVWMLLLDCRAERKKDRVCSPQEYQVVLDRICALPGTVQHLVIQLGIPIAYPRMVFLENVLESKMNPLVALGKSGALGLASLVNKFNSDAELLDDLRERNWFIEQVQAIAQKKRVRVTFLSGDVHCAAVGLLKTLRKGKETEIPPAMDHRYMINVVSSAIVNTPPPKGVLTMVSTLATKTHRTLHHLQTDETMIPLFDKDTNGQSPKSKYIMGRRNWCAVRSDRGTGELVFNIRVEIEKGGGRTVGYAVRAPPPRWS